MIRFQHLSLLVAGFVATSFVATGFSALPTAAQESAINPQSLWQQFYQQADELVSIQEISQAEINRYPKSLLLSSSQYPNFSQFQWQEIQQLWQISQRCQLAQSSLANSNLQNSIEFELALCKKKALASTWFDNKFDNKTLLHPAGGSFADRYLASLDKVSANRFLAQHQNQLTLANTAHPLHPLLSELAPQGVDALLSGYRAYLSRKKTLWLNNESGWKAIAVNQWQPLAQSMKLKIVDSPAAGCSFRYSNLCLTVTTPESQWSRWALALCTLIITSLVFRSLYQRRQDAKERQFILQLLTHELRTPITSLGLTVELFRDQFDDLSDHTQQAVWRLMADHQRLAQLTETSTGYLTTNSDVQLPRQRADISDWLDHCLGKYQLPYTINEEHELELPYYWLGICLDNLIKNAQQHGKGEITIDVKVEKVNKMLRVQVSDQGNFPNMAQRWLHIITPPTRQANMGIGLTIVSRLMKKMGGKLICQRKPTRCILELPL